MKNISKLFVGVIMGSLVAVLYVMKPTNTIDTNPILGHRVAPNGAVIIVQK